MNKGCRGTQRITRVEALTTLDLKGQGDRVMGTWGELDPGGELWSCGCRACLTLMQPVPSFSSSLGLPMDDSFLSAPETSSQRRMQS